MAMAFDTITSADALYLAQYLVGFRDGCFNLLPQGRHLSGDSL